jgi:segregation and condensation protein A
MTTDSPYEVQLNNVFEGPMDLLVYLIQKNEVDIYDIPISMITDQFIQYIEWMQSLNIDFAGDFLVMAATLTQIKSKMLLPVHENDEEELEDPRMEITGPLLEYIEMKKAAEQLAGLDLLGDNTFARRSNNEDFLLDNETDIIQVGLFELIDAFQKMLGKISDDSKIEINADTLSVKDRMTEIIDMLEKKDSVTFDELFSSPIDRSEIIVTFLAILEMVKMSLIRFTQHVQHGIIRIFYI